ncbi:acyltransferase family protein [Sphingomonas sp.]|uniref:acyltransferase family protein n=1 Tax=Sphingomonas sp. TaxID=28214 RepID=UPI0025D16CDF|nr:acyltransferase family protein [Sphingomonas sp.]
MAKAEGYRPDIDGLRALAILPVLAYHAHLPGITGGFVGVDVFFVISGYLITRIIAREIDEHRFSILHFYERRARRILPALLPMIVAVLGLAAWLYLPGDFEGVPRSALAATLFASNLLFFHETGYFQIGAEAMPLLHSWSLAIEEQFYIFFPLLLIAVGRWLPLWRIPLVAGTALASFALAVATQGDSSGIAFYLLPPRAWELFAGGLVALGAIPAIRARWLREGLAAAGLAALLVPIFVYDRFTTFPGMTALAPVLGAAALIHAAPGTATGKLLGLGPLRWVGLISYSLYLWHWPLIVFTEYATEARLAGWLQLAVIAASFLLAWLSWRFVEAPFRAPGRFSRPTIFAASAAGMASVCAVALALVVLGPWPQRFGPEVGRMAAAKDDFSPYRARCHDTDGRGLEPCVLGAPNTQPTALVWGDSHGVEFAYVLSRMAEARGASLIERTHSSCPPVIGYQSPTDPSCTRSNQAVLDAILADPRLSTIYLAGFWESPLYAAPRTMAQLDATIQTLIEAGRHVVLIGPVPPNQWDVPRHLARLASLGRLDGATGRNRADITPAEERIARVANHWRARGLSYIDPAAVLCDARSCAVLHRGVPLYFDHHHPSVAGASLILGEAQEMAALGR